MTTKRHRRAYRRRALQSARDARKRTGRKACGRTPPKMSRDPLGIRDLIAAMDVLL